MTPLIYVDTTLYHYSPGYREEHLAYTAPVSDPFSGEWRPVSRRYKGFDFQENELMRTAELVYWREASVYATTPYVQELFKEDAEPAELPVSILQIGKVTLILPLNQQDTLCIGVFGVALMRKGEQVWFCSVPPVTEGRRFWPKVAALKDGVLHLGYYHSYHWSQSDYDYMRLASIPLADPPASLPYPLQWPSFKWDMEEYPEVDPALVACALATQVQDIQFGVMSDIQDGSDGMRGPDRVWSLANLSMDGGIPTVTYYDTLLNESDRTFQVLLKTERATITGDQIHPADVTSEVYGSIDPGQFPLPPQVQDAEYDLDLALSLVVWSVFSEAVYSWFWTDFIQSAETPALVTGGIVPKPNPGNPGDPENPGDPGDPVDPVDPGTPVLADFILGSEDTGEGDMGYYAEFGGSLTPDRFVFEGMEYRIFALVWNEDSLEVGIGIEPSDGSGYTPPSLNPLTIQLTSGQSFAFNLSWGWGTVRNVPTNPWPIGAEYGFNIISPEVELVAGPLAQYVELLPDDLSGLVSGAVGFFSGAGGEVSPQVIDTLSGPNRILSLGTGFDGAGTLRLVLAPVGNAAVPATVRIKDMTSRAVAEIDLTEHGDGYGFASFPVSFAPGQARRLLIEDISEGNLYPVVLNLSMEAGESPLNNMIGITNSNTGEEAGWAFNPYFSDRRDTDFFYIFKLGIRTDLGGALHIQISRFWGTSEVRFVKLTDKGSGRTVTLRAGTMTPGEYDRLLFDFIEEGVTGFDWQAGETYNLQFVAVIEEL